MKSYYDALFYDPKGAKRYYDFVNNHAVGPRVIEFACGTGDIMKMLSPDFEVVGVDIDPEMIEIAHQKYPELKDVTTVGDFLDYTPETPFDTAFCIGDSTNYILTPEDLERFIETMTNTSNHLIVDCHHPHRLNEFADDYYEEGSTDEFDYAYQIEVNEEHLVHVINFLDGTFDAIYQWVFDPKLLIDGFEKRGYKVTVYTDYIHKGFLPEGEKIVLVATKETL
ncbi:class I SAM-dependent methyltransferase [Erysipelothrix aquatica]|uniref:class I SAM-dependent methyltransferase n=1 Tax=Erysipelothrix aquatica TaxID=2683714 RepID=UPI001356DB35|nr:class I SAM-dependent methyltransferase [Erysipelothrix aquatica]